MRRNRTPFRRVLLCAVWLSGAAFAAPARKPLYEPEPATPAPALSESERAQPSRLLPASARLRYGRDTLAGLPEHPTGGVEMRGWQGERLNAQVLAVSPGGFEELSVEPLILTFPDGTRLTARLDWVRYTLANGSLVPDILDGSAPRAFPGCVRPLWLSVDLPRTCAGTAEGTLRVRINGQLHTLPVSAHAQPFRLPEPRDWACHLDLWQHPDAVARWHDVPMWSPAHLALLKPQMQRLAAMGQKTITATLIDEAWDGQTYDRFRGMIAATQRLDGSWAYDYTAFDTWVRFMREEIGLSHATIHCYTLVPWSLRFAYYSEAAGRILTPRLQPGTPEYEAFWGPFLTAFVEHLRAQGWEADTRLAMDERPDALLRPAHALARKYAPSLPIVAACNAPSDMNSAFADVSYAYEISEQLFSIAAERRAKGHFTTFYVCCFPARPNTFMASTLAESEWLLPFAAHCGLDGFLRWAYHSWVENPLHAQDYTAWPSGDTSLLYPGDRPSLRLEALRNGIETFEKLRLLRLPESPLTAAQRALLEAALARFTVSRGAQPGGHLEDLEALDRALDALCTP